MTLISTPTHSTVRIGSAMCHPATEGVEEAGEEDGGPAEGFRAAGWHPTEGGQKSRSKAWRARGESRACNKGMAERV